MTSGPDDQLHQLPTSKGIEPTKKGVNSSAKHGKKKQLDAFWAGALFLAIGLLCILAERALNFFMQDTSIELLVVGGLFFVFGLISLVRPDLMHTMQGQDQPTSAKLKNLEKWLIPLALVVGIAWGFFSARTQDKPDQTQESSAKN